ncbi:PadR family transcriptional regulator [Saccharomonospora sp. NPDC006951]
MATAKLTPLAMAVLELLHERPMHPYEMNQLMRRRHVSNRVTVKAGSLYHTVERLVGHGFAEIVDTRREGKRPERTVYAITPAGRDAFDERAKAILGTVAHEHPEFLTGLAVIDDLDRDDVLHELNHRALRLEAEIAKDDVIAEELRARQLPETYWLDWRYSMAHRRFELEWVRDLLDDITTGKLTWTRGENRRREPSEESTERRTDEAAS